MMLSKAALLASFAALIVIVVGQYGERYSHRRGSAGRGYDRKGGRTTYGEGNGRDRYRPTVRHNDKERYGGQDSYDVDDYDYSYGDGKDYDPDYEGDLEDRGYGGSYDVDRSGYAEEFDLDFDVMNKRPKGTPRYHRDAEGYSKGRPGSKRRSGARGRLLSKRPRTSGGYGHPRRRLNNARYT